MESSHYDLCVIGGGINGAGIARDAAGRGLKTLLVEAEDLAGATSSASTKLIHGGLRYLEYYEFKLVHEALKERSTLLGLAPHIIWPLNFVLPHEPHLRPAWMIRLGLFLYDHLAGHNGLPGSRGVDLRASPYGAPFNDSLTKGFSYADCWVDDARLVALNAVDAKERGAHVMTRTACQSLRADADRWTIGLQQKHGGASTVTARMLVNAAGPWVRQILDKCGLAQPGTPQVRLVKGSHIVVMKLFEGDQAYILQQPDRRIVFAIPYEKNFTLVGTTDEEYTGDPRQASISPEETNYLCDAVNRSFRARIRPADVVWSYSGVRPLLDDGEGSASAVTRDYRLVLDHIGGLPLLSVFGGKITTYRHLAEDAVNRLHPGGGWTSTIPLPGGDIPDGDFGKFVTSQTRRYPWLPGHLVYRYARAYGTRMDRIIRRRTHIGELGKHYGGCLYEAEVNYLIRNEFARTAKDILWRRSKLGLHLNPEAVMALEKAMPDLV